MTTKRVLRCRDLGFDCAGVIVAVTDDEVLGQAGVHALTVHGLTLTPELVENARSLIRDSEESGPTEPTAAAPAAGE